MHWFYLLCRALVSLAVILSVCLRREAEGGTEQIERRLPQKATLCSEHTGCAAVIQLRMTENYAHSFEFNSNPKSVPCAFYT